MNRHHICIRAVFHNFLVSYADLPRLPQDFSDAATVKHTAEHTKRCLVHGHFMKIIDSSQLYLVRTRNHVHIANR